MTVEAWNAVMTANAESARLRLALPWVRVPAKGKLGFAAQNSQTGEKVYGQDAIAKLQAGPKAATPEEQENAKFARDEQWQMRSYAARKNREDEKREFVRKNTSFDVKKEGDDRFITPKIKGKPIGELKITENATANAQRVFPNEMPVGAQAFRIRSIYLDEDYRGQGLGKKLYLQAFSSYPPETRFYNGNTEPDATATLKAMAQQGLINLKVKNRWPSRNGEHICWLTDKGRELAKQNKVEPT